MNNLLLRAFGAGLAALALGHAALPAMAAVSRPVEESESRKACNKPELRPGAAHGENVAMNPVPVPESAESCTATCGEDGAVPISLLIRLHENALSIDAAEPESNCRQSGAAGPANHSTPPEKRT